jgi:hypothetical protein
VHLSGIPRSTCDTLQWTLRGKVKYKADFSYKIFPPFLFQEAIPIFPEVKEWVELYLHSPNTPSWRGARWRGGAPPGTSVHRRHPSGSFLTPRFRKVCGSSSSHVGSKPNRWKSLDARSWLQVGCGSTSQCISPTVPVVRAAVCGRALSWRQTLWTDRSRRFERKSDFTQALRSSEQ